MRVSVRVVDFGPRSAALCGLSDSRKRVGLEVVAHVLARRIPDRQQNALPFVTARTVLMRLAEISDGDRAVDGRDDLGKFDVVRILCEDISATDAALRTDQPRTFQREEDLFEIRLGKACTFRDVANRSWTGRVGVEGEGQQRATRIVASRGNTHGLIVVLVDSWSGTVSRSPSIWRRISRRSDAMGAARRTRAKGCASRHTGLDAEPRHRSESARRFVDRRAGLEPTPSPITFGANTLGSRGRHDHVGGSHHNRDGAHLAVDGHVSGRARHRRVSHGYGDERHEFPAVG